jgi:hypothetical protein
MFPTVTRSFGLLAMKWKAALARLQMLEDRAQILAADGDLDGLRRLFAANEKLEADLQRMSEELAAEAGNASRGFKCVRRTAMLHALGRRPVLAA